MKRQLFIMVAMGSFLYMSTLALGNPATLPQHPGYPMGAAKDPVTGQSVANDPGKSPPSQAESLRQAGEFHDGAGKENRANIVYPDAVQPSMEAQDASTRKQGDMGSESMK